MKSRPGSTLDGGSRGFVVDTPESITATTTSLSRVNIQDAPGVIRSSAQTGAVGASLPLTLLQGGGGSSANAGPGTVRRAPVATIAKIPARRRRIRRQRMSTEQD